MWHDASSHFCMCRVENLVAVFILWHWFQTKLPDLNSLISCGARAVYITANAQAQLAASQLNPLYATELDSAYHNERDLVMLLSLQLDVDFNQWWFQVTAVALAPLAMKLCSNSKRSLSRSRSSSSLCRRAENHRWMRRRATAARRPRMTARTRTTLAAARQVLQPLLAGHTA